MSYPRSSMGPTGGLPSSQSHMGSFNASQSVASTPGATPPPPRHSQQSSMAFSYSNGLSHGSMTRNSFGGYGDTNGYGMVPYQDDYHPPIYTAVYSNVSVYEMEVNGVAVMRRRSDSWLNATQILKVAGVVKARRTKTLEKEIAAGEHEKVQGGYGKYQGTWVSYQRGVDLCHQYHVEELLRPLLEYDMGQDGVNAAGQGTLDTPTKEQALAAQRKRMYTGVDSRGKPNSPQGTFFQNISRTAASAVNAMNKARFDSPAARNTEMRRPSLMKRPSQQRNSQDSQVMGSQQSMYSTVSDSGFGSNVQRSNRGTQPVTQPEPMGRGLDDTFEPPRKRMRSASNQGVFTSNSLPPSVSMLEPTPTEPNDSFYEQPDQTPQVAGGPRGVDPLPPATTPQGAEKVKLIMTLFLDKRVRDFSSHPAIMKLSGEDLEIPLDEFYNTALHWAAMLARLPLVNALIGRGVNIYRVNASGETALQKAVGTRNNLDYRSFPKLLQVLAPTLEMIDHNGRSVLHHIAFMAATGGGGHVSARHYLEALLEFIVRHGGSANSQTGDDGQSSSQNSSVPSLGRFISEIVNLRDDQGDTALNIAGRARTVLVPQLLEVGADPHIPNHTGLRPADYGVGVDMVNGSSQPQQNGEKGDSFTNQLAKTKQDIIDAATAQITAAIRESLGGVEKSLSSSLVQKQGEFDHWHSKIRESAKARQIEQNRLDEVKRKMNERVELKRRIKNLEQSSEDLLTSLKNTDPDASKPALPGDADQDSGLDATEFERLFPEGFDPSKGMTEEQTAFLATLPSAETMKERAQCYEEHNKEILAEVERLKSRNVVLGETYRRMVMACTEFTAEQADDAAEELLQCVKELDENPVPEDEAIEILMKDRGQDW